MSAKAEYEIWVDVGGTFTDCFAVFPDGSRRQGKVLSSGITKGRITEVDGNSFIDNNRRGDPRNFWQSFQFRLVDDSGEVISTAIVREFDDQTGRFYLSEDGDRGAVPILTSGMRYELSADLEAPVLATRWLLECPLDQPLPPIRMKLGTTRGTNALLTRRGAKTLFAVTEGFADLLDIGYQNRPQLFQLAIQKTLPLASGTIEIPERLDASGNVLVPIDRSEIRNRLIPFREQGFDSIAICLLHSYRNSQHEMIVGEIAQELGFQQISISSQLAPLIKAVSRGDTAVMDAYVGPKVQAYLNRVIQQLNSNQKQGNQSDLRVMTSAGGLVQWSAYRGKDSILSGPAGGVVGLGRIAEAIQIPKVIGFDMGGTSTDVSRWSGAPTMQYEGFKAGVRLMVPMMAIETVAAGGGSICWFDGVTLRVGPDSAGSDPGPACYGRGGPLTVTDLNLLTGRVAERNFPFPLDRTAAQQKLFALYQTYHASSGSTIALDQLSAGLREIANQHMAEAIRNISVAQGSDPREYALVGFGGAAGQHLCEIAQLLGMRRAIDHPAAGLLSALGIGLANINRTSVIPIYRTTDEISMADILSFAKPSEQALSHEIASEGVPESRIQILRQLEMRYIGTEQPLVIPLEQAETEWRHMISQFSAEHLRRFSYDRLGRQIEIVSVRIEVVGETGQDLPDSRKVVRSDQVSHFIALQSMSPQSFDSNPATDLHRIWSAGKWSDAPVLDRGSLQPGDIIPGPALILGQGNSTVVDAGWVAEIYSDGTIVLDYQMDNRAESHSLVQSNNTITNAAEDPVRREVMAQRLSAIATQMGIVLEQTAISVNVKERRDFSCAIFTADGQLVANAPHVPVHLGAMGETIRQLMCDFPELHPGDCLVTNDPYRGGSHLPDVTVVMPVFDPATRKLAFFTANRAHHAEIGGKTPGSMSPTSTTLGEEGVVLPGMLMTRAGQDWSHEVENLLRSAAYPSRNVAENLADLAAQQAACARGAQALLELCDEVGLSTMQSIMEEILDVSSAKAAAFIMSLPAGRMTFLDYLDDQDFGDPNRSGNDCGLPIAVAIERKGEILEIDFSGTAAVQPNNLNANPSIVTAAVMYVLRCLIDDDLPLNAGLLRHIELRIPERSMLNPLATYPLEDRPAVAAGNVETSQRVVDVLLGALQAAAASQGTMNNLLFGDGSFGYYETICGGSGATQHSDGADAVHTHMTNTRLTDPEILESRYPVRLIRFQIRRGSGGSGLRRGGDGVIREIEFLRSLQLSLISSRRNPAFPPYGLNGGSPGAVGRNWLKRAGQMPERLPGRVQLDVESGDRLILETPGGGGFGRVNGP